MALPSTSVWEVRSVGSDTNGGGFDSAGTGTDFSQQDNKNTVGNNISVTDVVTAGSTTITSLTASFTSAINGNIVFLSGGTGSVTPGWYRLTFVNATTCTTDRSAGLTAGTGVTLNVGGALATPAQANANAVAHNIVYVKATANYVFTTPLVITLDSSAGSAFYWIGYTTTRTDNGRATFTSSTNSIDVVQPKGAKGLVLRNLVISSTAGTRGNCINCVSTASANSVGVAVQNCVLDGGNVGIKGDWATAWDVQGLQVQNTEIKNSVSHGIWNSGSTAIHGSFIHGNGGSGMFMGHGDPIPGIVVMSNSVFYNNTANGYLDNAGSQFLTIFINCAFSTNGAAGVSFSNSCMGEIVNCIFDANTTSGIEGTNGSTDAFAISQYNNAFFNNTSGARSNVGPGIGDITLTGSPYTSIGTDFSLNSTVGAGGALRAAGFPGVMPAGTGFVDVGPLQHQDTAGSSTIVIGRNVTNYLGVQGDF